MLSVETDNIFLELKCILQRYISCHLTGDFLSYPENLDKIMEQQQTSSWTRVTAILQDKQYLGAKAKLFEYRFENFP